MSLLDGLSKTEKIAEKCAKYNMPAVALSDHGVLSGIPSFLRETQKRGIKGICGVELYIAEDHKERATSHLVVLAKNLAGWKTLLKLVTESNKPENFYYKPRLTLEQIGQLNEGKNLIAFSGHCGSTLADALWTDKKAAYGANSYEEARAHADKINWEANLTRLIGLHLDVFGEGNFYLENQKIDMRRMFAAQILDKVLTRLSEKLGVPKVATADSHYVDREDAVDQQILLCSNFHTTLSRVHGAIARGEDTALGGFFKSNNYHLPIPSEMAEIHTEEELRNSLEIASRIEEFDINNPPMLPRFTCPNGMPSKDYLMYLCREGMDRLNMKSPIYEERLQKEYSVITKYNLEDYFLIMADIVKSAWDDGEITGAARGSAGGCLLSLLTEITHTIDPIGMNLLFERFLNEGRLSGKKRALPDIDVDFMKSRRQKRIEYITNKWGKDCVAGIATYGALKGKSALKIVLRVREACTPAEQNEITKCLPSDASVSDDLQEQLEEDGEKSVIQLALEDAKISHKLRKWVHLDSKGEICGEFAPYFKQAKRLEWVHCGMGQHASAVVIADRPLTEFVPMVRAKKNEDLIIGFSHTDVEPAGGMKVDILGSETLDRMHECIKLINERHFSGV
jgi:DNA polymerase-3 subunit alpha